MLFEYDFPARIINDYRGPLPSWWGASIERIFKSSLTLEYAYISPSDITGWPRRVRSAVTDARGVEVEHSVFMRSYRVSVPPSECISNSASQVLSGRSIYLGWLIGHYGHFLTETLSRVWGLLDGQDLPDWYVFHSNFRNISEVPSHVMELFSLFGIDETNLVLARNSIVSESLRCPSPGIKLDSSVGRFHGGVFDFVVDGFRGGLCNSVEAAESSKKIYLSRRMLENDKRGFNEVEVAEVFRACGFDIIEPERLSLPQQIYLYNSADWIAGPVGSAIHNALFCRPGANVLVVAPSNFLLKNDCLISAMRQTRLYYYLVDMGSTEIKHSNWKVDVKSLHAAVESLVLSR